MRAARAGSLPLPRLPRSADRRHRVERPPHPRGRVAPRRRLAHRARSHRGGELHRARRDDLERHHDRGHRAEGPGLDPARLRAPWHQGRGRGHLGARAPEAAPPRRGRSRRPHPQDRGRAVARLSRRPDLDRPNGRDSGVRHGADLREDVREPALLRRQARRHGRAHRPLRSASRGGHRPGTARRAAHGEP